MDMKATSIGSNAKALKTSAKLIDTHRLPGSRSINTELSQRSKKEPIKRKITQKVQSGCIALKSNNQENTRVCASSSRTKFVHKFLHAPRSAQVKCINPNVQRSQDGQNTHVDGGGALDRGRRLWKRDQHLL